MGIPVGGAVTGAPVWPAGPPAGPALPGIAPGPPDGGQDRAPGYVLVLAVLVLTAVAVGAAYMVVSSRDRYPDEWDHRVTPIADWVAQERGLAFKHPVEVNFLSEAEYTAAATSDPAATEEESDEIEDAAAELRALGLISGEFDLVESVDTLSDSGTLAFYSPDSKQVFVRGTELTPGVRVTLAHELVHVLQDQHFDLSRSAQMSSTQAGVLRALAEGDAGRIDEVYADEVLTDAERAEYEKESSDEGDDALEQIREEVPDAVTALFTAPYIFGEPLVAYLDETDGDAAIDEALRNPPSEQVLFNPQLWKAPEADDVDVDVVIPSGTTEIERDDFGPVAWYLVLASRVDPQVALDAVDGLGGDRYVTYRDGDRVCVRATVVGDDDAATAGMESALQQWAAAGAPGAASVSRDDDDNVRFQACDPGAEAAAAGSLRLEVLALPATRTAVYMELQGSGATDEQSWCVADNLVGMLTLDDLTNPDLATERDLSGMMTGVMMSCAAAG